MRNRVTALTATAMLSLGLAACNGDGTDDGADPTEEEAGIQEEGTGTDALDTDEGMVEEPADG